MNGPTRPRQFLSDRQERSGRESGFSSDVFGELDQFVDSEPAGWSQRRPRRREDEDGERRSRSTLEEALSAAAPFDDRDDAPSPDEFRDPAFGKAPESTRRAAFAARLSEELAKPPAPAREKAPPVVAAKAEPAPAKPAIQARPAAMPDPPAPAPLDPPKLPVRAAKPLPPAPDPLPVEEIDPVMPAQAEDAPADALQWELDNAIGAIVVNSTQNGGAPVDAPQMVPDLESDERPQDTPVSEEAPSAPSSNAAPSAPVAKAAPDAKSDPDVRAIGSPRRLKPIPTFRFDRRPDDEDGRTVVDDPEDPLSSILLSELTQDDERADGRRARDDDPVSEMLDDTLDEHFDYDEGDDDVDRLPPSLSRAAGAGGQSRRGPMGIAAVMAGAALVGVAAVVGINVFAGSSDTDAPPPVIRADARDVKVRPAEVASDAEPDIMERTGIGETASLVMPDAVSIDEVDEVPAVGAAAEATEGLISRRVRTVVVRPDGTIVRAGDADAAAEPSEEPEILSASVAPEPEVVPEPTVSAPATQPVAAQDNAPAVPQGDNRFAFAPADDRADVAVDAQPIDDAFGAPEGPAPGAAIPRRRPTPPPRTTQQAAVNTASPTRSASAPATPAQSSAPSSAWGVQVSSQRSEADARQAFRDLQRRYPALLAGRQAMIIPADLGARGRFYRVRLGVASRGEAASFCQRLKSAGADCFISRN